MSPYRALYEPDEPEPPRTSDELTVAYGALIAVSAIQLVSGAQLAVGVFALVSGVTGLIESWRSSWKTPSSSC